jgi:hypothetical protein
LEEAMIIIIAPSASNLLLRLINDLSSLELETIAIIGDHKSPAEQCKIIKLLEGKIVLYLEESNGVSLITIKLLTNGYQRSVEYINAITLLADILKGMLY